MYAQTVRTPIVRRYEHPTPLTIMNMFKSVHFQNRKCDCIKSLKLGEINTQRLIVIFLKINSRRPQNSLRRRHPVGTA